MARNLYFFRTVILLVAFGFLAQLNTSAHAMNVYNNASFTVYVTFSCGFFCGNSWTIDAGDMDSRPNESGNLFADGGDYGCDVDVDEHGWVVVTGTDQSSAGLTSYHQDGSVDGTCGFVSQGTGPF